MHPMPARSLMLVVRVLLTDCYVAMFSLKKNRTICEHCQSQGIAKTLQYWQQPVAAKYLKQYLVEAAGATEKWEGFIGFQNSEAFGKYRHIWREPLPPLPTFLMTSQQWLGPRKPTFKYKYADITVQPKFALIVRHSSPQYSQTMEQNISKCCLRSYCKTIPNCLSTTPISSFLNNAT